MSATLGNRNSIEYSSERRLCKVRRHYALKKEMNIFSIKSLHHAFYTHLFSLFQFITYLVQLARPSSIDASIGKIKLFAIFSFSSFKLIFT